MNTFFLKLFMATNVFVIRLTHGRLGSQLGTQTILLLHSRGRRSGKEHVTPIAYFQKDGDFFVIGSNWGNEHNAAWYHNLMAHPQTIIEVKGKQIPVIARQAKGAEYDKLWNHAIERHPPYLHYREMTKRHIPIIVFEPERQ
jgi:deazaflavin-dependent oxidoreductase (nitroreductase family)